MPDSNVPAVRQPEPSREIARTDTDSWVTVMRPVIALAEQVVGTEFVPKSMRNSVPAITAAILYGREIGLPPMTALTQTHVIEGRPSTSAEGMRAMILAGGHEMVFDESTGATCKMRARRRGEQRWTELTWTIDMARAAGLTGKSNWKSYPRAMLVARCTGDLARMVFPDVIHGFRTVEEMQDLGPDDGQPGDAAGETAPATTSVSRRKRTTAKKAAAALPAGPGQSEPPAGGVVPPAGGMPPLPGEPGFSDHEQEEGSGDGVSAAGAAEPAGEDSEGPSSTDVPEPATSTPADSGAQTGEPEEAEPDAAPAEDPGSPDPDQHPAGPRMLSKPQHRMFMGQLNALGIADDREERLLVTSKIIGRAIDSSLHLTHAEAKMLIDTLGRIKDRDQLNRVLDEIDAAEAAQAAQDAEDEARS